jgi:hypothetical protein
MRALIPGVSIYLLVSIVSGEVQAAAQTSAVPPTLKTLNIQKICARTNPRYLLARTIVQAYKISEDLIDWTDIQSTEVSNEAHCHLSPGQHVETRNEQPAS